MTLPTQPAPLALRHLDALLEDHVAILGKTGAGKTFAAKGWVEHLLDKRMPCCILDPTGVWWGLRLKANGKAAGYPAVVFGGRKADVPIVSSQGAAIGELVASGKVPASIIDTKLFTVTERTRFAADFAEALFRHTDRPLHLVIDEAHLFAPKQKVQSPQAGMMLSTFNNLVSGGRAMGLRIMLLTQRPAKLHNDCLTQVETLVAMKLMAPHDKQAVRDWIKDNADPTLEGEIMSSLARLPRGTGWVWHPNADLLQLTAFPAIGTFDSSKAPDAKGKPLASLAPIDLTIVRDKLAIFEEERKANDPAELKKRIKELEAAVAKKATPAKAAPVSPATRPEPSAIQIRAAQVEGFNQAWKDAADATGAALAKAAEKLQPVLEQFNRAMAKAANDLAAHVKAALDKAALPAAPPLKNKPKPLAHGTPRNVDGGPGVVPQLLYKVHDSLPSPVAGAGQRMPPAQRKILIALAQHGALERGRLAMLTGSSVKGGGFNNKIGAMRTAGLLTPGWPIGITDQGLTALGSYEPLPTGRALIEYWAGQLPPAQQKILMAAVEAWPNGLTRLELATASDQEVTGGSFNNKVGRLRTLGLLTAGWPIKASQHLMEG